MSTLHSCEALVMKIYNIGDDDRYCVLLTPEHGRIAACAKGVRKITSKSSGALQSFQHLHVDVAEHSSGMYIRSASCIDAFRNIRSDVDKFTSASRACELLLRFLHDTEPSERIFALALDYIRLCNDIVRPSLLPTFQWMLLRELGLQPRFQDYGIFSDDLRCYLSRSGGLVERMGIPISDDDSRKLSVVCGIAVRKHLMSPLRSEMAGLSPVNACASNLPPVV